MFKDLGIKSSEVMDSPKLDRETNEIEMNFKAGDTLKRMLVAGKMPEFFATVLVPEGEKIWKKEYVVEHLELMEDIGDATALEIVGIFLTGRANLIVNLWEIFIAFLNKNKGLIKNLNSLTKAEEANKSLEDV